jgi:FAD/FMN-containing dehydrogenase
VQPGVNFKSLQETLHTHGLFLPPEPESSGYSTIGGAIANNASGRQSFTYGDMSAWVDRLEVVLANGEVIQTGPLSKRDVSKKLGLPTLEGELYRAVDTLLNDEADTMSAYARAINASSDNVGYRLSQLRVKGGGLDLTQLFVGAQGTLGIITEAIMKCAAYVPASSLVVAAFENMDDALSAAEGLAKLKPTALELVDGELLDYTRRHLNVELPTELMIGDKSGILLFAEASNRSDRDLNRFTKRAEKVCSEFTDTCMVATDFESREKLWAYRYQTAGFMAYQNNRRLGIPLLAGVSVPPAALHQFVQDTKTLFTKHHIEGAVVVHAQSNEVLAIPSLDLARLGDRQLVFKLLEEYFAHVIKLGGSIATTSSEGRLRAPYSVSQTGSDLMTVFQQLKTAADPHTMLNPEVKIAMDTKALVEALRKDYSLDAFAQFLPRI